MNTASVRCSENFMPAPGAARIEIPGDRRGAQLAATERGNALYRELLPQLVKTRRYLGGAGRVATGSRDEV